MKLVFISDTHNFRPKLPKGDILIHSGDLTMRGTSEEVLRELDWLKDQLKHFKHVIFTPGNHDVWFDFNQEDAIKACKVRKIKLLLHRTRTIEGIKFFGSPYTPWFHSWSFNTPWYRRWAFNRGRTQSESMFYGIPEIKHDWKKIPKGIDVLITHGPPYGILDDTLRGVPAGCEDLLRRVAKIKPVIHAFGHIHEAYGEKAHNGTLFINASSVGMEMGLDGLRHYRLSNAPVVIDYEELTRETL